MLESNMLIDGLIDWLVGWFNVPGRVTSSGAQRKYSAKCVSQSLDHIILNTHVHRCMGKT